MNKVTVGYSIVFGGVMAGTVASTAGSTTLLTNYNMLGNLNATLNAQQSFLTLSNQGLSEMTDFVNQGFDHVLENPNAGSFIDSATDLVDNTVPPNP